jgi:hypothetical protein
MSGRIKIAVLMLLFMFAGCTTMQQLRPQDPALADGLKIGDRLIVYEKSGRIFDIRFVRLDGGMLRGSMTDDGLDSVEIRLDNIERIEAERVAVGRTTGAVLGGIVLAPIVAVGAGLALAGQ